MKKRLLSLYVENEIGVLAKISGMFSGKSYNLKSLTVGETEDTTVSRMTLCVEGDDQTFEQIKKQLNRCIEVIKVIDLTNAAVQMKEILFLKVSGCNEKDRNELFHIADVFQVKVVDYGQDSLLLECTQTEARNNDIIKLISGKFNKIEVVRGGNVAIESLRATER